MSIYLSIDAGGSKCAAILYDDQMNLLGRAKTGGVNLTQTSLADARANVAQCLDQVLSTANPKRIDCMYASFVGPVDVLHEEVRKRCTLAAMQMFSEPVAGLLAGAILRKGILALSGTGSDVFWVRQEPFPLPGRHTVGGWGPILGDQGSGTWIGQEALREAVKTSDGWGNSPLLLELLRAHWPGTRDFDMVRRVHDSPAPFRQVASLTPLVGHAAQMGDSFSLELLHEAGRLMAHQTLCLLAHNEIPPQERVVVCCGGAWNTHPAMFAAFVDTLLCEHPQLSIRKPWFEHVLAGPALILLESGMNTDQARTTLATHFPDYQIGW